MPQCGMLGASVGRDNGWVRVWVMLFSTVAVGLTMLAYGPASLYWNRPPRLVDDTRDIFWLPIYVLWIVVFSWLSTGVVSTDRCWARMPAVTALAGCVYLLCGPYGAFGVVLVLPPWSGSVLLLPMWPRPEWTIKCTRIVGLLLIALALWANTTPAKLMGSVGVVVLGVGLVSWFWLNRQRQQTVSDAQAR